MVTIDQIVEKIEANKPEIDVARVREAFEYAKMHLKGMYRVTGDSMLIHGLEVTDNLLAFNPDQNSILAALLHDLSKTTTYDPKEITLRFGEDVTMLVEGMKRLQSVHLKGGKSDLEAFRRMLLSLAQDLRLLIIRLADLLHDVESLEYVPQLRRKEVAREMLDIYAPIASRLGIYSIKCRLEDLAFKYLYPDKYEDLRSQLDQYIRSQEKFLDRVKKELNDFMSEQGMQGRVEGRLKNLYSVYRKMKKKSKASLNEIYDIFAFRVILPTKYHRSGLENTEKLYTLLGLIHSHWTPLPDRFKDYVAVPKVNGYRSLHTTLIGDGEHDFEHPFEIQLRSEAMHQQAEFGFASHWLYEDTRGYSTKLEQKTGAENAELKGKRYQEWLDGLAGLQQELAHGKGTRSNGNKLQLDMFQDHIFVFTPDGEVKDLPKGATPVDFAYAVHTDVGHRCQGAKVNNSIVPLDYQLQNGDRVEILTKSKFDPKPHWLSFVKSSHAKAKIKSYFKGLDNVQSFKEGKDLVNRYLLSMEKPLLDDNLSIFRNYASKKLSLKERQALIEDIGNGAVNVGVVLKKIFVSTEAPRKKKHLIEASVVKKSAGITEQKMDEIMIAGESNVPLKLSSCCKPQSGDAIVGYVTRGNAIRIHQLSCKFLKNSDPARVLEANWGYQIHQQRLVPVTVDLKAIDRVGLIRDIASTIASFNVNIVDFTLLDKRDNLIHRHMVLEVMDEDQYQKIMKRLRQVRNVLEVNKVEDEKKGF